MTLRAVARAVATRQAGWESEQTANPVQTTGIFGMEMGFFPKAVDAGFPLQYDDFPLVRALSSAG